MDLYKAYALCINTGRIVGNPDIIIEKYTCEFFETLEKARQETIEKNPIDYRILEIRGNNKLDNAKFRMELTQLK